MGHGKVVWCDGGQGRAEQQSPKEDKSGLGCGKEVGCGLSPPVDGSGVGHGKVVWCVGGQGRAEQQSPKEYKKGLVCGKEDGCSLTPPYIQYSTVQYCGPVHMNSNHHHTPS